MKTLYTLCLFLGLTFTAIAQPVEVLSVPFNTSSDDFAPVVTKNGKILYFTSDRSGGKQKIYVTDRNGSDWNTPNEIDGDANDGKQVGAPTLTPDGLFMIFSSYKHDVSGNGRTDLYSARKIAGKWTDVQNLGAEVNSDAFDAQPSLSSDGQTLYFVSDRDGGKGGTDIYATTRNSSGNWSKAINISELNSVSDDMSPSISSDNSTIFISSNRTGGQGGFDIYTTKRTSGMNFGALTNVRAPINSPADEYFYSALPNSTTAYFSRTNANGDLDVMTAVPNPYPSEPVLLVQGVVNDGVTKLPIGTAITITDLKTGKKVANLRSDDATGEYYATLTAGHTYSLTASKPGYVFYSERFEVPTAMKGNTVMKDISLSPLSEGSTRLLIFFDYDEDKLKEESVPELERVVDFMRENSAAKVAFEGHTDDVGAEDYNDKLSQRRADAVKQYLIQAGITADRMTTTGFGKRKPLVKSTADEARAQNRRVEMKIK